MNRLLFLFLLLLFISIPRLSLACGNEYFNTIEIPLLKDSLLLNQLLISPHDSDHPYWWNGFGENIVTKRDSLLTALSKQAGKQLKNGFILLKVLKQENTKAIDYKLVSDYAWHELRVGDKKVALAILEFLYSTHANEYNILANLGTAYEVMGNNSKALELLQKAVAINPQSHLGSEWIHLKILEQKIASTPNYSKIINLGNQNFAAWMSERNYTFPQPPESLKKQIAFQLHERISFIKPPDPIVAQLVLDFADVVARYDGHDVAIPFYEYAANYGTKETNTIVLARKKILKQTREEIKTTFSWATVVWVIPLLFFILVFISWIKSKKK